MSTSRNTAVTDFDAWLKREFAETGSFTIFVVLVRIEESKIHPLASTYFNVIGDEVTWPEIVAMLASSKHIWDGAAFFPVVGADDGPLGDPVAKLKLRELEARLADDRLVLNEGHFFDLWGRRMQVEEIELQ